MNYIEHPKFGLFKATLVSNQHKTTIYIVADNMSDALEIAKDMTSQFPDIPHVDKIKWLDASVYIQQNNDEEKCGS